MACPAILTGENFLLRLLTHIDCQAQIIGSYGWQALGEPGSIASVVVTSLLTIFVALFGVRLLFGPAPGVRDVVFDILKIGLVLTLAFSWPAFRTLVHDPVLHGPAEIAAVIGPASEVNTTQTFAQRLQAADTQLVELTSLGTGRQTGAFVNPTQTGGTFSGTALEDESTFGTARLFWLGGIIGSLGLLRTAGALLLALAPLAAGLLLFGATRGLFAGWMRGLVLVMAGSLGVSLVLAIELAILEPLLGDALRLRRLGYATPSAPTELLAVTLGFAVVQLGMIWLLARVAFQRGWVTLPTMPDFAELRREGRTRDPLNTSRHDYRERETRSRAQQMSDHVAQVVRREQRSEYRQLAPGSAAANSTAVASASSAPPAGRVRLGSRYRRASLRTSQAAATRDRSS